MPDESVFNLALKRGLIAFFRVKGGGMWSSELEVLFVLSIGLNIRTAYHRSNFSSVVVLIEFGRC